MLRGSSRRACPAGRNFNFLTYGNNIRIGNAVICRQHLIGRAILSRNFGKGVSTLYRVNGICAGTAAGRINYIAFAVEHGISRIFISTSLCICQFRKRSNLTGAVAPTLADTIHFGGCTSGWLCGHCRGSISQALVNFIGKLSHSGIHPTARARLVRKPSMYCQHTFPRFRGICKALCLILNPEDFCQPVTFANINTQFDQLFVYDIFKRIRLFCIRGTLNRDCPLVICIAG